jgi:hypothetical protein
MHGTLHSRNNTLQSERPRHIRGHRKDDETHRSSKHRTFYDKQSLIETRAVHMPLSQSDKASLFNGEMIRLIADERDLELLGVWERLGRA